MEKNFTFAFVPAFFNVFSLDIKLIAEGMYVTLYEAILGILISLALSFLIVFVAYSSDMIFKLIYPLLFVSQTIPIVVIAPIVVIIFGYGVLPKIVIVILNCFFPICISLLNGIKSVDNDKVNLMKTMGATKNQILRYALLPDSRSHLFSGLKISVTYALMSAIIGEWLGGEKGIGIYMIRAKKSYAMEKLFVATALICIFTVLMTYLVTVIEKKRSEKTALILTCAILIFTSFKFLPSNPKSSLDEINLVLDYTPNTNHTGIYVAQKLGFFQDERLKVNIHQPPEDGATSLVLSGKAEFGIDFQDQLVPLLENEELSKHIKVVATILQHNTAVIISNEKSNIKTLSDLNNKTFAVSSSPIEQALIKFLTKDLITVKFTSTDTLDILSLLQNGADAMCAYYGWDVIAAKIKNIKVNYMFYNEIDPSLDFYTPLIVSNSDYIIKNKDTVKRFLKAVSKGYTYTANHPVESSKILCEEVPELDKNLVMESHEFLKDKYIDASGCFGSIDKNRWNQFYRWLYKNGVTNKKIYERDILFNDCM